MRLPLTLIILQRGVRAQIHSFIYIYIYIHHLSSLYIKLFQLYTSRLAVLTYPCVTLVERCMNNRGELQPQHYISPQDSKILRIPPQPPSPHSPPVYQYHISTQYSPFYHTIDGYLTPPPQRDIVQASLTISLTLSIP